MNVVLFIFTPIIIYFFNKLFKKIPFFLNYSGEKHQKFTGEKFVPLSGGTFLIFFLIIILFSNYSNLFIFLFLIFIMGIFSDFNIISSPIKRFLFQTLITSIFVIFFDLHISNTKIIIIDELLNNIFLSFFFTTFCFIVLLNGTNFIDGLNGLVLTYYIFILLILYRLGFQQYLLFDQFEFFYLIYLLSIILIFNFFNQLFLGDAGSYCLSFLMGFFLINIYNNSLSFSPFFIILLLWYPCFENLFSIIRKFGLKKSPIQTDNNHFHHLVYYFLKKKIKINNIILNNLSSFIINIYNLTVFYISSLDIYNSQYQIFLILFNIIIYSVLYLRLFAYKYNKIIM